MSEPNASGGAAPQLNAAAIDAMLNAALRERPERVKPLRLPNGRRFWLKRVERLSARLRLQKGDPNSAFTAERNGLHYLASHGLPVPQILREGEDYFLLPDVGPSLTGLVQAKAENLPDQVRAAFSDAGKALARLHHAGLAHGRPAPRDICWDGSLARFIDLERFSPARRSGFWQAMDIVILTQSCFTLWPADTRWLDAALQSYSQNAPEGAMDRVEKLAKRLSWLNPISKALLRLKPHSRELNAVRLTLAHLRR